MGRFWAYIGLIILLGFLFVSLMAGGLEQGTYVSTDAVQIKADVMPNSVSLSGQANDGGLGFRGLEHQVLGDSLIVSIRYGSICQAYPKSDFHATIKQDMQKINTILFRGPEKGDTLLVWQRNAANSPNNSYTNGSPSMPFEPEPPPSPEPQIRMN